MRVRIGVVRVLIGVLWVGVLIVPIGVETRAGTPQAVSVGEALIELAGGRLGVGILGGVVAGGELARQAVIRILLAVLAGVAFWLTGLLKAAEAPAPERPRWRHCPECGARASTAMSECPACGTLLR